jgi:beta-lactamase regulating signal transducer with metallopeptidase domain
VGDRVSVTDVVLLMGAIGVLITTITTAIVTLRRVEATKEVIRSDVADVHKIVNQQRTDMLAYQEKLVASLVAAGIHVPEDRALRRGSPGDDTPPV